MKGSTGQRSIKCQPTWLPKTLMVSIHHNGINGTINSGPKVRKSKTLLPHQTSVKILHHLVIFIYSTILRAFNPPSSDSHTGQQIIGSAPVFSQRVYQHDPPLRFSLAIPKNPPATQALDLPNRQCTHVPCDFSPIHHLYLSSAWCSLSLSLT